MVLHILFLCMARNAGQVNIFPLPFWVPATAVSLTFMSHADALFMESTWWPCVLLLCSHCCSDQFHGSWTSFTRCNLAAAHLNLYWVPLTSFPGDSLALKIGMHFTDIWKHRERSNYGVFLDLTHKFCTHLSPAQNSFEKYFINIIRKSQY